MGYQIKKEAWEKHLGNDSEIELNSIFEMIRDELGLTVVVHTSDKSDPLGIAIANSEEIKVKLRQVRSKRDANYTSYSGDEEEFDRLYREAEVE